MVRHPLGDCIESREDYALRIESLNLEITPAATLRWHRDVEDNSVANATFDAPANQLLIVSEVIIQQYDEAPLDFLVADDAIDYPFVYTPEDRVVLSPYMDFAENKTMEPLNDWVAQLWQPGERLQTYALLRRLNLQIHRTLSYRVREEPGVQSAAETLSCSTGSCRDYAHLFMAAARRLGFASRFVSGYLHSPPDCRRWCMRSAFGGSSRFAPAGGIASRFKVGFAGRRRFSYGRAG